MEVKLLIRCEKSSANLSPPTVVGEGEVKNVSLNNFHALQRNNVNVFSL